MTDEMKVSERRAVILYADINGFSNWSRRVRPSQVRDLLVDTYEIYSKWQTETHYWMKKLSDGFIAVRELDPNNDRQNIIISLRHAHEIAITVNRYLRALPFPRPPLFRLRGTLGDVLMLQESSGRVDFAGYQMTFGRRCLDIFKEDMLVITEAIFDALGRRACAHMRLSDIGAPSVVLSGIEPEDQKHFYRLDFHGKKR